ncbi:hypothetical protein Q0O77_14795, partial [Staphylococcus aureus]|nr:hypothetical protein [Staphylococcus aureus]
GFFCLDPLFININNIRQSVEGVKRNTDRQDNLQNPRTRVEAETAYKIGKGISKEIIIFEEAEKSEIDTYAKPEPKLFGRFFFRIFNL